MPWITRGETNLKLTVVKLTAGGSFQTDARPVDNGLSLTKEQTKSLESLIPKTFFIWVAGSDKTVPGFKHESLFGSIWTRSDQLQPFGARVEYPSFGVHDGSPAKCTMLDTVGRYWSGRKPFT
jgi:hypothetical protein